MSENEKKYTEKTQQQEGIEYLRWFCGSVIADFPVSFIPVVKRQQWLNYTGYPEKGQQPCNKHKHFPLADFGTGKMGKMAFCKNYTDNQKDNRFHQLKKLKTRNIVY